MSLPIAISGFYSSIAIGNPYRAANFMATGPLVEDVDRGFFPFVSAYQNVAPDAVGHLMREFPMASRSTQFAAVLRQQPPQLVHQAAKGIKGSCQKMNGMLSPEMRSGIVASAKPRSVVNLVPYVPDPWKMSLEVLLERLAPGHQSGKSEIKYSGASAEFSFHLKRLQMRGKDLAQMVGVSALTMTNWKRQKAPEYLLHILQHSMMRDEVQQSVRLERQRQDAAWKCRNPHWEYALRFRALLVYWDISLREFAEAASLSQPYLVQTRNGIRSAEHLLSLFDGALSRDEILGRCKSYRKFSPKIRLRCQTFESIPIPRPFYHDPWNQMVRETRIRLGLARSVFAVALNVSRCILGSWETGKRTVSSVAQERIRIAHQAKDAEDFRCLMNEYQFPPLQKKPNAMTKLTGEEEKALDDFINRQRAFIRRYITYRFSSFSEDDRRDVESKIYYSLMRKKMSDPSGDFFSLFPPHKLKKVIKSAGFKVFWEKCEFSTTDRLLLMNMREQRRRFEVSSGEPFSAEILAEAEGWPLDIAHRAYDYYLTLEARYKGHLPFVERIGRKEDRENLIFL